MERAQWEEDLYYVGKSRGAEIGARLFLWMMFISLAVLIGCAVMASGETPADDVSYASWPPFKGKQKLLVLRVIDGDTFEGAYLTPWKFRLSGIQAPEKNDVDRWKASRARLEDRLTAGSVVTVDLKGPYKYAGATMAEVYDAGGHSINTWMVERKYAVPWDGKGDRLQLPPAK